VKIYIIRHADPDYSIDSLTPKGWREAELLSDRVVKLSIDDFYCSPLGRAKDTAKPSLEKLRKEAEILDWLQEFEGRLISPYTGNTRVSWDVPPSEWCNQMQYYTLNEWDKPDWIAQSTASKSYIEVTNGIDELLLKYGWKRDGMIYHGGEDKTIALFCHFALGITILSYLLGISPVVAQNNFFLAPTSVTTLVTETDDKGCSHFRATAVGDTSHLYVANEPVSESGLHPNFMK
jgi:probable phosphoglycerate mutase